MRNPHRRWDDDADGVEWMNRDPYRQAHPRRTDWYRVAAWIIAALVGTAVLFGGLWLVLIVFGS